jgi:hypothetical protein
LQKTFFCKETVVTLPIEQRQTWLRPAVAVPASILDRTRRLRPVAIGGGRRFATRNFSLLGCRAAAPHLPCPAGGWEGQFLLIKRNPRAAPTPIEALT